MNTIEKGDSLEKKVFDLIKELIDNNQFYVNREQSQVFWKKAYYSKTREKNIIFDITIESYIAGSKDFSLLTVIECKNLNKNVSVDDIEEFDSKLRQVGEHNTKGILVSTNGFARTTIKMAKNLKIGLLRISGQNRVEWVNYRKNSLYVSNTDDTSTYPLLAIMNNKLISNFASLLLELNIIDLYKHHEKFIRIPFLEESRIEYITKN